MKNLITILAVVMAFSTTTFGQGQIRTGTLPALKYVAGVLTACTRDTTTNTDTTYLWTSTNLPWQYDVVLHWTNTKVSGTPGGSVVVQGSMDNSNWYTLINDKTQALITDTVTILNGTTTAEFFIPACKWEYLRIRGITSGTQTSYLTGTYWYLNRSIIRLNN